MSDGPIVCKTCKKTKAPYACGLCHDFICKSCAQFIDENHFSFLRKIPSELAHQIYCYHCFDDKVAIAYEAYAQNMEKAKEIIIFTKEQSKITRLLKRTEPPYEVENCLDEEEALLKMSFYAVEDQFNALVDVSFKSKKIVVGSHKKSVWQASAVPMNINPDQIREY